MSVPDSPASDEHHGHHHASIRWCENAIPEHGADLDRPLVRLVVVLAALMAAPGVLFQL